MADLSRFFNISHDVFCILDSEGFYKKVNPTFLNLLGYSEQELFSYRFTYYIHPDDVTATEEAYAEVTKGMRNRVIENRFRKKSGEYCWLSWSSIVYDDKGLFYAAAQNITERRRLQEALKQEQENSQGKITAAVILAQEQERAEISRELHDNVNQILTTVKLYTELYRDGVATGWDTMDRSSKLLQDAIDEIRNLSKRLSVVSLGNVNFRESIEELLDSIAGTNRFSVLLDAQGIEYLDLEKDLHLAVYRIVQEHLTNILKHAEAQVVKVTIDIEDGFLKLEIRDDGKGFDPAQKITGIGIHNMKTRAGSVGGALHIQSAPGKGSVLLARFPLES